MTSLVATTEEEPLILERGANLLRDLITMDDWLLPAFAVPDPVHYRQYLLHCDSLERFSMVSFVWGPGQRTPVHDHTVWGLIGVLRGAETCQSFSRAGDGSLRPGNIQRFEPGSVSAVSPRIGDIHEVANALPDRASVSIHVYGANIGAVRRHTFNRESRDSRTFVSGYSNDVVPNIWDRSAEVRATV